MLEYAIQKDREDELQSFRSRFYFPNNAHAPNRELIYFCGNSLGLQPRNAEAYFQQELKDWQNLAIEGYWDAKNPWLTYARELRPTLSKLVGSTEDEVTVMNALTVNLHLLLLTFYRPTSTRYKIMIEAGAFPSDQYAVESRTRWHGYNPDDAIIEVHPREGEKLIHEEDILKAIDENKDSLALVLLGGINYYTGQLFDIKNITAAAHKAGAIAGFDLAHAAGNARLSLHDWNVDFAVWCSYKYLNGGPGAAGGVFIHERHARNQELPRLGGWWGNHEATRFRMEKGFIPKPTAEGWNMSTSQVFNMVGLKASLALFEEAGFERLLTKSRALTDYLHELLNTLHNLKFEIITPTEPHRRAAQLSLYFKDHGKAIHKKMLDAGIVVDYREPGVIRVAPAPLYNSFEDVYRFYNILQQFQ